MPMMNCKEITIFNIVYIFRVIFRLQRKSSKRAPSISHTLSTGSIGSDQRWLIAHNDPSAGYYTFSSGITFGDFCTDGEMRLAIADLGNGQTNVKLNIYHGTQLFQQIALINVPAGVVSFYQDGVGTTVPALAVAAGQFLFVYKNLKPFYKFQLPFTEVNQTEVEIWNQVKEEKIEIDSLTEMLQSLQAQIGECEMTSRSQRFLGMNSLEEKESFIQLHKMDPLKRSTTITCLTTLKKNVAEENAATCLIIGTEDRDVLVIEPDAFTVLASIKLPSIPVFIESTGLFDVEFRITASCRDATIYSLKRGFKSARACVHLSSQPVGIVRVNNYIVVGCMDQSLSCYTTKGNICWTLKQPAIITSLTSIYVEMLGLKLVAVALDNCTITIYQEKYKVDFIPTDEPIVAMKFGKYGREGSTLVTVSQSGSLCIRILKRTAKFQPREIESFDSQATVGKLNLPKKTKIFVDQTMREREESTRKRFEFVLKKCHMVFTKC